MPAPTSPAAATHPAWCDPRCCSTHVDVRHSSTPIVIRAAADDVEITIALHRGDEVGPDGQLRPVVHGVTLELRNTESTSACCGAGPLRADGLLLPAEAEELGLHLLALGARAAAATAGVND